MANDELLYRIRADAKQAMDELRRTSDAFFGVKTSTLSAETALQKIIGTAVETGAAMGTARESAAAFTSGLAEEQRAFDALRASIDPAFAALRRYETGVNDARIAEQLGVASKEETARVLLLLQQRYDQEAAAATRSAAGSVQLGRSYSQAGAQAQNAAYQVGDFFVQVAAGTDPMRAAAMQLPQLLQVLGVWGAIAGAAVAGLAPLVAKLFETKDAAEDAQKQLEGVVGALQSYERYAAIAGSSTDQLNEKFGRFAENMRRHAQWMAQVELGKAMSQMGDLTDSMIGQLDAVSGKWTELVKLQGDYQQMLANGMSADNPATAKLAGDIAVVTQEAMDAAAEIGLTVDQALGLRKALDDLGNAKGMTDIEAKSRAALDAIMAMYPAGEQVPEAIRAIVDELDKVHEAAMQGVLALETQRTAAGNLAEAVASARDILSSVLNMDAGEDFLSSAIAKVEALAAKAWSAAYGIAEAMAKDVSVGFGGRPEGLSGADGNSDARGAVIRARIAIAQKAAAAAASTGGGGGGGGSASPLQSLSEEGKAALADLSVAVGAINAKVEAGLMGTAEGADAIQQAGSKAADALAEVIAKGEALGTVPGPVMAEWKAALADLNTGLSDVGKSISQALTGDLNQGLLDAVTHTKSLKDAFSSTAQSMLADIAKIVTQRFTNAFVAPLIDTALAGLGFAQGGVPALGEGGTPIQVTPFASGGVPALSTYRNAIMTKPTFFAMGGLGVAGEAGPEAIMPLTRGAGGRLGVSAQGMGANLEVNVITPPGGTAQVTRRSDNGREIVDVIVQAAKEAIVDDIAGGGMVSDNLSRSFGLTRKGY